MVETDDAGNPPDAEFYFISSITRSLSRSRQIGRRRSWDLSPPHFVPTQRPAPQFVQRLSIVANRYANSSLCRGSLIHPRRCSRTTPTPVSSFCSRTITHRHPSMPSPSCFLPMSASRNTPVHRRHIILFHHPFNSPFCFNLVSYPVYVR